MRCRAYLLKYIRSGSRPTPRFLAQHVYGQRYFQQLMVLGWRRGILALAAGRANSWFSGMTYGVEGLSDLFEGGGAEQKYSAKDIEVLEGLEPVRRRPGMYIGGTDEAALHHLASEILDNSMDEAVAGHATLIEVTLAAGNSLSIRDNGRGIPVDPHPKFKNKSALEVILTTLHSGGKFSGKAYATSGGLHGVGSSVVNALASSFTAEVARDKRLWRQEFSRGIPKTKLIDAGPIQNRRGTMIRFTPDTEIFGDKHFIPARLYRLCRSKAYLFRGVRIKWSVDPALVKGRFETPPAAELHFPGGLRDSLAAELNGVAVRAARHLGGRSQPAEPAQWHQPGQTRMGLRLAGTRQFHARHLLQHRTNPVGRHP